MKKLAILLSLVMMLSLAACNRTPAPDDNATTTTTIAPHVGENDGVTYKNDYFGLAFAPADGWNLYDADEIADRNLPILPMGEGESYAEAITRAQEFYDMYAAHGNSGNIISVRVENMSTLYETLPSDAEYRDIQASTLEGIPMLTTELITVTVDGKDLLGMKVLWGEGDDVQTDVSLYFAKENYMVTLNFSSLDGDHTAEWAAWFDFL